MPAITFSGIASGIDADSIIKALTDAKRTAILPIQNQIDYRTDQNKAYEEYNTKLLALKGALEDFLSLSGGGIQKKALSNDAETLTATAGSGALNGVTTISSITKLAKASTFSFNDRFTAVDQAIAPGLAAPANISITVGSGPAAEVFDIEVNSSTTLVELNTAINEAAPGKVSSSLINTGTDAAPAYALVMNTQQTGLSKGAINVSVAQEIQDQGLFQASQTDQAQDAEFTIAGLGTITRESNQINDLLPGISFTLLKESAVPVTVTVTNDAEATASKVQKFVDAYNDLVSYSAANSKIERVEGENENKVTNIYGSLARTRLDEAAITSLRSVMSSLNSNIEGSEIRVLADLGIKTATSLDAVEGEEGAVTGTLKFDSQKFEEALTKDPAAVQSLFQQFADSVAKTQGLIDSYTQFNGQIDVSINSNKSQIESANDRIERVERSIAAQEAMLRKIFTNLETTVGRLNAGSSAISSILNAPTPGR